MRYFYLSFLSLLILQVPAQPFIQNKKGRALTFKEIQQQFAQFRKENDLSKAKHWKNFARYENEMVRHTNGRGEPDGFKDLVDASILMAAEKEAKKSQAAPWYPIGPNAVPSNFTGYMENGIGRVNVVGFHPTDVNTFFVGVAQGGLWKTTNGGASYTPLTDNLPITRISDVLIVPTNTNVMYISVCDFEYVGKGLYTDGRKRHTHFGVGVYKTTDGGLTWSPTGLTFQLTNGDASLIRKIVVNPANTNELLACGVSGMYKSTNAGTSWTKQLDSLFWDMEQDPQNPAIVYAATGWVKNSNQGHAAIYKSTNFGATWTMLTTNIPQQGSVQRIKLAVAPSNPNYVYALAVDDLDGLYGIYQSTNAGSNWTFKPAVLNVLEYDQGFNSGGQGTYDVALCVSDTNEKVIYTGGINIWGSLDGGSNFDPVTHWTFNYGTNTVHADIHNIQIQPVSKSVFVSCDGGVYKTNNITIADWNVTNWPTNWTNLSNGMQITSFYRLSSSKNSASTLLAGAQDNASFFYNGTSWSTVFGGDGMDNFVSPTSAQTILGSSQYGNFYFSPNNGQAGFNVYSNPNNEASEWVAPVTADYNKPGVLYIGNENLVKSIDHGQNWSMLGSIFSNTVTFENTEVTSIAVANTNSHVIYATRRVRHELNRKGIVFKTTNGGATFTNITSNLPDTLFYTGVEVMPTNSNVAVVSMAGFANGHKVYKTTNGGTSWTNISYNLPNIPVNCIKYVPGSGQLIVATDVGIYYLNSSSNTWQNYSMGLPNVIVSDIEFNPAVNKIYISTFGRGIWESNLSALSVLDPVGISESSKPALLDFNVYPTVNNGTFKIDSQTEPATLDVIDVQGRIVHQQQIGEENQEIRLNVKPGTYYLRVTREQELGVKKIVVQ